MVSSLRRARLKLFNGKLLYFSANSINAYTRLDLEEDWCGPRRSQARLSVGHSQARLSQGHSRARLSLGHSQVRISLGHSQARLSLGHHLCCAAWHLFSLCSLKRCPSFSRRGDHKATTQFCTRKGKRFFPSSHSTLRSAWFSWEHRSFDS